MFNITEQLKKIPEKPGVYLMKDKDGEIIYIGKANSLKSRVRQYFQSNKNQHPKVRAMIEHISEFEYIITDSEIEALILESNLVKKHKPKYNVLLRDDKQFPYIKVTMGEPYPRVIKTRKVIKDKSKYFGPYTNVGAVNHTIEILKKYYPLKTCNKTLEKVGDRPCLNFHIGQCLGPCTGHANKAAYMAMIDEVILFLGGKYQELVRQIEGKMKKAAAEMNFEKAAEYRDQINSVASLMEKQKMVLSTDIDQDLMAMARDKNNTCVMVFFVRNGKLMGREDYMVSVDEADSRGDIISAFIKQFYAGTAFVPKEILVDETLEEEDKGLIEAWLSAKREYKVTIKQPQKGEKKALLELVHKNAVEVMAQFSEKLISDRDRSEGALRDLGMLLSFTSPPLRMEAFDISNTQGHHSVASMVVFENGKPKHSDYRRFRIKTIEGPNDYGSIQEVIYRRFKKGLEEKESIREKELAEEAAKFSRLPNLLLIDGGIGQVQAAEQVLIALGISIPVAGMVKDDRHRTKDLIYKGCELDIQSNPNVFRLIAKVQDEAHRFAINYHKSLRGKTLVHSILDDIPGIGKKRRIELLKHFASIENIKKASMEELCEVQGMNKRAAADIKDYFDAKKI